MVRTAHTTYLLGKRAASQSVQSSGSAQEHLPSPHLSHKQRIIDELKALGVSRFGMMRAAIRSLPGLLHHGEHINGIVYGQHKDGSAILVATDRRLLFVEKKLFYQRADDLSYDVVSGVNYGQVSLVATITLHTRTGDFTIRTLNLKCAKKFVDFIEARCLDHLNPRRLYD